MPFISPSASEGTLLCFQKMSASVKLSQAEIEGM